MRIILAIFLTILTSSAFGASETVRFKWDGNYPHNKPTLWDRSKEPLNLKNFESGFSTNFNAGSPNEFNRIEKSGELEGVMYRADNEPTPFVIWMHGCTGLPKVVKDWTVNLAQTLNQLGYGLLVLDSYSRRFVLNTCGAYSLHWGGRRTDDAHSALDYLIDNKLAKRDQVYIMGQSAGGITSLHAVSNRMLDRKNRFAAAFSMEPHCGIMNYTNTKFYAPIFFLLAEQDEANIPGPCLVMAKKKHKHPMQVAVMKGAFHSYMFKFAPTTATYGKSTWREGYNERAATVGMQVIAEFFKNPKIKPIIEYK